MGNQVDEALNHYVNLSNYDDIWVLWTTLKYIHGENVKLTAMKYIKNTHGNQKISMVALKESYISL